MSDKLDNTYSKLLWIYLWLVPLNTSMLVFKEVSGSKIFFWKHIHCKYVKDAQGHNLHLQFPCSSSLAAL